MRPVPDGAVTTRAYPWAGATAVLGGGQEAIHDNMHDALRRCQADLPDGLAAGHIVELAALSGRRSRLGAFSDVSHSIGSVSKARETEQAQRWSGEG